jgi:hypothetical protein
LAASLNGVFQEQLKFQLLVEIFKLSVYI